MKNISQATGTEMPILLDFFNIFSASVGDKKLSFGSEIHLKLCSFSSGGVKQTRKKSHGDNMGMSLCLSLPKNVQ